jgi:hypothetical protein
MGTLYSWFYCYVATFARLNSSVTKYHYITFRTKLQMKCFLNAGQFLLSDSIYTFPTIIILLYIHRYFLLQNDASGLVLSSTQCARSVYGRN